MMPEHDSTARWGLGRRAIWHWAAAGLFFAGVVLAGTGGCGDSKQASATTKPSDPFTYQPHVTDDDLNISGGDITHFDKKAFGRDVDSVLNP